MFSEHGGHKCALNIHVLTSISEMYIKKHKIKYYTSNIRILPWLYSNEYRACSSYNCKSLSSLSSQGITFWWQNHRSVLSSQSCLSASRTCLWTDSFDFMALTRGTAALLIFDLLGKFKQIKTRFWSHIKVKNSHCDHTDTEDLLKMAINYRVYSMYLSSTHEIAHICFLKNCTFSGSYPTTAGTENREVWDGTNCPYS